TKTGQFMGTVDYVAPEQIQGHEVDGRTDGYSLACVLYECLAGRVPYAKDSDVATLFGHLQDPPPPVTVARPSLPHEIDGVVARGMAKQRDDRPPTCSALIDEAARALGAPSGPREVPYVPPAPTVIAPPPPGAATSTPPGFPVSAPTEPRPTTPAAAGRGGGSNNRLIAIFAAVGVAIAAIVVVAGLTLFGGGDEPGPSPVSPPPPAPVAVANTQPITTPESGQAIPYPSTIEVSGADGTISSMTVTLTGLTHLFPDEVDLLLVGPTGQSVVLIADAGGFTRARRLTLTFDDAAGSSLPDEGPLVSGSVRPGQFAPGFEGGSPAPPPPYGTALSAFSGTDPNGTWQLFMFDDTGGDAGAINGGWSMDIEMGRGGSTTSPEAPPAEPTVVSNSQAITIPDFGQADPYPSTIEVSGLSGTVADVKVTLAGFGHEFPDDVDVLLVGPSGQSVVLMADMGGFDTVGNVTLTFDDAASAPAPNATLIVSGSYRPTREKPCCSFDGNAPAPPAPHAAALAVFDGTDPNGTWSLFVFDDGAGDVGAFSGGWSLEISTAV
ncbi:MAG: serine/threonine protein kinase, partial [Actinomycetota bacterium]